LIPCEYRYKWYTVKN